MASMDQVTAYSNAVNGAVQASAGELARLWGSITGGPPELVRDAILDVLPSLTQRWGEAAAAAAADWYEELRADAAAPGRFTARVAPALSPTQEDALLQRARWALGPLFAGDPSRALSRLTGLVDEHIRRAGGDTIAASVEHDPARPRFARIPVGETCAFCIMLAGRGAVYHSPETAGEFTKYHHADDCVITPIWPGQDYPDGYDPDVYYRQYLEARNNISAVGVVDTKDILAEMRHLGYGTDGHKETVASASSTAAGEARRVLEAARVAEPGTTSSMRQVAHDQGMDLVGLEFRLKTQASLARKIASDAAANEWTFAAAAEAIGDALRYTMTTSEQAYARDSMAVIAAFRTAGWTVRVKNFWTRPENPYQGVNLALTSPDGQLVELQLHTPASFEVKNGDMHKLYEQRRVSLNTREQLALDAQMLDLAAQIPVPPDVARIE